MAEVRIPSVVENSVSPRAREYLKKVRDFVENECERWSVLMGGAFADHVHQVSRRMKSSKHSFQRNTQKDGRPSQPSWTTSK
jgi:hypothetical protein